VQQIITVVTKLPVTSNYPANHCIRVWISLQLVTDGKE